MDDSGELVEDVVEGVIGRLELWGESRFSIALVLSDWFSTTLVLSKIAIEGVTGRLELRGESWSSTTLVLSEISAKGCC
jgi:hypothetical protein